MYIKDGEILTINDIIEESIHKAWEAWDDGDDKLALRYLSVVNEAAKAYENLSRIRENY